ncbi:ribonuclease E inhibitor RraB [Thalassoroseus pseudoceratinae]|uniref:ribonuclease E inhibitor RraB n=1 Tax=Thalassoroseus pseudoceratinae TaxID=2713176 RepID=UPI0014229682|nr:ribonuclease E inhibitor RraB [Thalassoroseus pseudoceratinae]
MNSEYPNNADGNVLRTLAESGNDMTKPMEIDFAVAVPNELAANDFREVAAENGYDSHTDYDNESGNWSVYCTKSMVPTYQSIMSAQVELDDLSRPFDGYSDGWGTFGNVSQD